MENDRCASITSIAGRSRWGGSYRNFRKKRSTGGATVRPSVHPFEKSAPVKRYLGFIEIPRSRVSHAHGTVVEKYANRAEDGDSRFSRVRAEFGQKKGIGAGRGEEEWRQSGGRDCGRTKVISKVRGGLMRWLLASGSYFHHGVGWHSIGHRARRNDFNPPGLFPERRTAEVRVSARVKYCFARRSWRRGKEGGRKTRARSGKERRTG